MTLHLLRMKFPALAPGPLLLLLPLLLPLASCLAPPAWSATYSVQGVLDIPYAEIQVNVRMFHPTQRYAVVCTKTHKRHGCWCCLLSPF